MPDWLDGVHKCLQGHHLVDSLLALLDASLDLDNDELEVNELHCCSFHTAWKSLTEANIRSLSTKFFKAIGLDAGTGMRVRLILYHHTLSYTEKHILLQRQFIQSLVPLVKFCGIR